MRVRVGARAGVGTVVVAHKVDRSDLFRSGLHEALIRLLAVELAVVGLVIVISRVRVGVRVRVRVRVRVKIGRAS